MSSFVDPITDWYTSIPRHNRRALTALLIQNSPFSQIADRIFEISYCVLCLINCLLIPSLIHFFWYIQSGQECSDLVAVRSNIDSIPWFSSAVRFTHWTGRDLWYETQSIWFLWCHNRWREVKKDITRKVRTHCHPQRPGNWTQREWDIETFCVIGECLVLCNPVLNLQIRNVTYQKSIHTFGLVWVEASPLKVYQKASNYTKKNVITSST